MYMWNTDCQRSASAISTFAWGEIEKPVNDFLTIVVVLHLKFRTTHAFWTFYPHWTIGLGVKCYKLFYVNKTCLEKFVFTVLI